MQPPSSEINGAHVVCFASIDDRHRPTGNCRQIVGSETQGAAAGLAICQFEGGDAFYLFGCDAHWNVLTDTWHKTLDEARRQAEFEYEGISDTWQFREMLSSAVACRTTIDERWVALIPVRVGQVPASLRTPEIYVTVEKLGRPHLRVDVYRDVSSESSPFTDAQIWGAYLVIGAGHHAFVVRIETGQASTIELGAYFGQFYPCESCLLITSAERLFCVGLNGTLRWKSDSLGIDGVVVESTIDGVVEGQGEWDPPGGWRQFRIDLESGESSRRQ